MPLPSWISLHAEQEPEQEEENAFSCSYQWTQSTSKHTQKLIGCMDSHNTAMSWYIPVFLSFYCQIIFHCVLLLPSPNNGHWDYLHDYNTAFSPWTSITNPVPYSVKHNEIKPTDNYTHSCLPHQMRDVCVS